MLWQNERFWWESNRPLLRGADEIIGRTYGTWTIDSSFTMQKIDLRLDFRTGESYCYSHGLGEPDRRRPWKKFQGLSFTALQESGIVIGLES